MRKVLSVGLVVCMLFAMTCVAYARYLVISEFRLDGEVYSTSAYGNAYIELAEDYDSKTIITLERAQRGSNSYRHYATLASKYSSQALYTISGERDNLNSAYDYRIKAEIFVYDDNGNEIDYDCRYTY